MRILGNSFEQYAVVALIILLTFFFAKLIFTIFRIYFTHYAKKKRNGFDNALINAVSGPLVWFFIVIGLYHATAILNIPHILRSFSTNAAVLTIAGIVCYFLIKAIDVFVTYSIEPYVKASPTKLDDQLLPIFRKGIKVLIVFMTIVIVLTNLGYNVSSLLAGLGIGGLALALAAQETIGNFFGSVSIFADKVFEVGDAVKIGDVRGTVKELGIRSTRLETPDGTIVAIPNAKIASERIENVTQANLKRMIITLGISYNTPKKKIDHAFGLIKKILQAEATAGHINKDFSAYFLNFGAYSLDIQLSYALPSGKFDVWAPVVHRINLKVKEAFDENKVEFAYKKQV